MKKIGFKEIKEELIDNMRRHSLVPVIGSGFTCHCQSLNGTVPSGKEYKKHMIDELLSKKIIPKHEEENLFEQRFSVVASIYQDKIPLELQRKYFLDNFTRISIDENKKDFLNLPWPYIYTLNIDDAIEKNSFYGHVVYANREVDENIFDDEKCVIKLHGDVFDMLTYSDSNCKIFSQEEYLGSLRKNKKLLDRLHHDSIFQNLIFIGCGLDDEIDLFSSLLSNNGKDNQFSRYICVKNEPSCLEEMKYQRYGITHCIIFDSYDSIYRDISSAGDEAQKIRVNDLLDFKRYNVNQLDSNYELNKSYLFFGKSFQEENHTVNIPYFFISRKYGSEIINNFLSYYIQLLVGGSCSGKSYVLLDVVCKIRNQDVFYFETRDKLTTQAFNELLENKNCVILADAGVLSKKLFESLLDNISKLRSNNIHIVIAVNKIDKELNSVITLKVIEGKISFEQIKDIYISNIFSKEEISQLNPRLAAIDVGIFDCKKTMIDNILFLSKNVSVKNKYYNSKPKFDSVPYLSTLIVLCTERKVYSKLVVKLDLMKEFCEQSNCARSLIDYEATWTFERNSEDNSSMKFVLNAEYWLCEQLAAFSKQKDNHALIVDAYKFIVSKLIGCDGEPDLLKGKKDPSYKPYILFDNINHIFSFNNATGREGLALIRIIYDGLNDLLSTDPNYMHQRAKCYIKSSFYESDHENKIKFLNKAFRDANVSYQVFFQRYELKNNDKILISMDHVLYTKALILCHKCFLQEYSDIEENSQAIHILVEALSSPHNTYDYVKEDSYNYYDVVGKIFNRVGANKELITLESHRDYIALFNIMRNN